LTWARPGTLASERRLEPVRRIRTYAVQDRAPPG
jgi:hypothetical protein